MKVGLKHFLVSKYAESGATVTYSDGKDMAEMVKADVSITPYEASFYSNNRMSDKITEFKEGSLNVEVDNLELEDTGTLLGHTYTAESGETPAKLVYGDSDVAPFVGVGFVTTKRKSGTTKYLGIVYTKVKFAEPSENIGTKGENITLAGEAINGAIMKDATGKWKEVTEHDTEAEALAAVKTYLSIA